MAETPANGAIQQSNQLVVEEGASQRELAGDEKAAVLLLALGPDYGKPIFQELDDIEIRQLSRAMSQLGSITQDMLDNLFVQFITSLTTNGDLSGNVDSTERLLLSFLPQERVDMIMEEIRGPAGRNIWEKLSNVQEDVLASFLKNEYPQTISVVLTKISTEHASKVLANLPGDLALDVVQRMLAIEPVQKEIVEKKSKPPCAPNSCRTCRIRVAATAMSRWRIFSTPLTAKLRLASSPLLKNVTLNLLSALKH